MSCTQVNVLNNAVRSNKPNIAVLKKSSSLHHESDKYTSLETVSEESLGAAAESDATEVKDNLKDSSKDPNTKDDNFELTVYHTAWAYRPITPDEDSCVMLGASVPSNKSINAESKLSANNLNRQDSSLKVTPSKKKVRSGLERGPSLTRSGINPSRFTHEEKQQPQEETLKPRVRNKRKSRKIIPDDEVQTSSSKTSLSATASSKFKKYMEGLRANLTSSKEAAAARSSSSSLEQETQLKKDPSKSQRPKSAEPAARNKSTNKNKTLQSNVSIDNFGSSNKRTSESASSQSLNTTRSPFQISISELTNQKPNITFDVYITKSEAESSSHIVASRSFRNDPSKKDLNASARSLKSQRSASKTTTLQTESISSSSYIYTDFSKDFNAKVVEATLFPRISSETLLDKLLENSRSFEDQKDDSTDSKMSQESLAESINCALCCDVNSPSVELKISTTSNGNISPNSKIIKKWPLASKSAKTTSCDDFDSEYPNLKATHVAESLSGRSFKSKRSKATLPQFENSLTRLSSEVSIHQILKGKKLYKNRSKTSTSMFHGLVNPHEKTVTRRTSRPSSKEQTAKPKLKENTVRKRSITFNSNWNSCYEQKKNSSNLKVPVTKDSTCSICDHAKNQCSYYKASRKPKKKYSPDALKTSSKDLCAVCSRLSELCPYSPPMRSASRESALSPTRSTRRPQANARASSVETNENPIKKKINSKRPKSAAASVSQPNPSLDDMILICRDSKIQSFKPIKLTDSTAIILKACGSETLCTYVGPPEKDKSEDSKSKHKEVKGFQDTTLFRLSASFSKKPQSANSSKSKIPKPDPKKLQIRRESLSRARSVSSNSSTCSFNPTESKDRLKKRIDDNSHSSLKSDDSVYKRAQSEVTAKSSEIKNGQDKKPTTAPKRRSSTSNDFEVEHRESLTMRRVRSLYSESSDDEKLNIKERSSRKYESRRSSRVSLDKYPHANLSKTDNERYATTPKSSTVLNGIGKQRSIKSLGSSNSSRIVSSSLKEPVFVTKTDENTIVINVPIYRNKSKSSRSSSESRSEEQRRSPVYSNKTKPRSSIESKPAHSSKSKSPRSSTETQLGEQECESGNPNKSKLPRSSIESRLDEQKPETAKSKSPRSSTESRLGEQRRESLNQDTTKSRRSSIESKSAEQKPETGYSRQSKSSRHSPESKLNEQQRELDPKTNRSPRSSTESKLDEQKPETGYSRQSKSSRHSPESKLDEQRRELDPKTNRSPRSSTESKLDEQKPETGYSRQSKSSRYSPESKLDEQQRELDPKNNRSPRPSTESKLDKQKPESVYSRKSKSSRSSTEVGEQRREPSRSSAESKHDVQNPETICSRKSNSPRSSTESRLGEQRREPLNQNTTKSRRSSIESKSAEQKPETGYSYQSKSPRPSTESKLDEQRRELDPKTNKSPRPSTESKLDKQKPESIHPRNSKSSRSSIESKFGEQRREPSRSSVESKHDVQNPETTYPLKSKKPRSSVESESNDQRQPVYYPNKSKSPRSSTESKLDEQKRETAYPNKSKSPRSSKDEQIREPDFRKRSKSPRSSSESRSEDQRREPVYPNKSKLPRPSSEQNREPAHSNRSRSPRSSTEYKSKEQKREPIHSNKSKSPRSSTDEQKREPTFPNRTRSSSVKSRLDEQKHEAAYPRMSKSPRSSTDEQKREKPVHPNKSKPPLPPPEEQIEQNYPISKSSDSLNEESISQSDFQQYENSSSDMSRPINDTPKIVSSEVAHDNQNIKRSPSLCSIKGVLLLKEMNEDSQPVGNSNYSNSSPKASTSIPKRSPIDSSNQEIPPTRLTKKKQLDGISSPEEEEEDVSPKNTLPKKQKSRTASSAKTPLESSLEFEDKYERLQPTTFYLLPRGELIRLPNKTNLNVSGFECILDVQYRENPTMLSISEYFDIFCCSHSGNFNDTRKILEKSNNAALRHKLKRFIKDYFIPPIASNLQLCPVSLLPDQKSQRKIPKIEPPPSSDYNEADRQIQSVFRDLFLLGDLNNRHSYYEDSEILTDKEEENRICDFSDLTVNCSETEFDKFEKVVAPEKVAHKCVFPRTKKGDEILIVIMKPPAVKRSIDGLKDSGRSVGKISIGKNRSFCSAFKLALGYCITDFLGERGSGVRARGEVQDFYQLRDDCLNNGTLFEDPEFPADDSSLFYSRRSDRYYEWLRPGEICDNPQLFVEGYSRFDVQQGELGDCWLLAAVANLTLYRRLFFQIVPDDQGFDEKYAGIFHFRFWQYGRWIDVVIDDRLPTYRGQLVYLHSTEENEFWSALLEKAYAKLHGSYEALKGGSTCEAMEDFTGGVTEMYEMKATPPNLFKIVLKAYERGSLMGSSLEPDPEVLEAETSEGLVRGHAYSITRVKYVDIQTPNVVGKIPLLRLRNPWGNETEWKGPWSDESPEWRYIPEHEKEELGLTFDNDGEFWMSFKDFQSRFDRLEICNLTPDSLTEEELAEGHKKQWEMSVFEGEWVRGVTAGGCRNYLETFWHNPQYRITLTDIDEDDDEGKCTVIVALMQKNRRSRKLMGVEFLTIGFAIYYLPNPDSVPKPLDLNFFKYNASVARSPSFINLREVTCRFKLPPGTYCIVPSTFEPNEEGEFLLRLFSENKNNMEENDEEVALGDVDDRVVKQVPTSEETQETDKVREFFLKLAGEDMEVDWRELKDILDYAMKNELPISKVSTRGVEAGVRGTTATTDDANADGSFLSALLGLICTMCKDVVVPIVEPASTTDFVPTTSSYESKDRGFSKDVCRSMVAMLDSDRSGKLGYEEFKTLWIDIRNWKNVFKLYDKDNSGALSGFEMRQALNSAGYRLNNHILNILMHRYGNRNSELNFDDFITCAVKLKTMIDLFKQKDASSTNVASFTLEDWIETTLYS